jgi:pyruvate dehydrogenase E1 component
VPFVQRARGGSARLRAGARAAAFKPSPADVDAAGLRPRADEIAATAARWPSRIVTTSPDVTVSTNLGPWVNRRGLFAAPRMADTSGASASLDLQMGLFAQGQHLELGIAEMNLFIMLSALGLSHSIFGERLLPIGTLYDPFIERGLDALNYACYQDARFMVVATPSASRWRPKAARISRSRRR